jgi:hypothetical protein
MEKCVDPWQKISDLIGKEKAKALAEFPSQEFAAAAAPANVPVERPFRVPELHPAFMATAASLLLAAGLASFLLLRGSWQTTPTAPADNLLAGSFLFGRSRATEEKVPEPRVGSAFSLALSAWGTAVGSNRAAASVARPVYPAIQVEHGDPAAVQRKIEKTIRANTIERVLTRFCQICKEV